MPSLTPIVNLIETILDDIVPLKRQTACRSASYVSMSFDLSHKTHKKLKEFEYINAPMVFIGFTAIADNGSTYYAENEDNISHISISVTPQINFNTKILDPADPNFPVDEIKTFIHEAFIKCFINDIKEFNIKADILLDIVDNMTTHGKHINS